MGWEVFEPVLSQAEGMDAHSIWQCAADIPEEWYEGDAGRSGTAGGNAERSTDHDPEVDRGISQVEPEPISELA
jgi:hypothetical protein